MMENRSFDHLLGFLSHESFDGRADVDGLHQASPNFDWANADDEGTPFPPTATPDGFLPNDLPHSRAQVNAQIAGGAMTGFIKSYFAAQKTDRSPAPMRFCRPQDIPITAALARRYLVCDRWFSSLPDDTMPNRLMALCGYTEIDTTSGLKPVVHPLPDQRTIFDWLSDKGEPFAIYVDADPIANFIPPTNLLLMNNQGKHFDHVHTLEQLETDWHSSQPAPSVIYIEPFYNDFATVLGLTGNCNHPTLPANSGESFLRHVYTILTSNPERWAKTMLVISYDEHGGFFDHVQPPDIGYKPPPGHTWTDPTPFTRLGVRVPGIVVSPLVEMGKCFKGTLDHTSILQLIVERFGDLAVDLPKFGDAVARKEQKIQSLSATLTQAEPLTDIVMLPAPPHVAGPSTSVHLTNLGLLFRDAIEKAKHAVNI
jgi:phospholipase C